MNRSPQAGLILDVLNERMLEYMTDYWSDWREALLEATDLSKDGWRVVAAVEADEWVRLVFARDMPEPANADG